MDTKNHDIACFARTAFRDQRQRFGVKTKDRRAHLYVIGKTGVGKSTLLQSLMQSDIQSGRGFALLDPHGDLFEQTLNQAMKTRREDLVVFDATDRQQPIGFNPLERRQPALRPLAAAWLLEAFKKIWADSWGPRLEHILRNTLLSLLDLPQATLADAPRLLEDKLYRKQVVRFVSNAQVRRFWLEEFEKYTERFRLEAIAPLQNKIGAFLTDPILYPILSQTKSQINISQIMNEGKILLVNLAKGKIGEPATSLLGALLVASLSAAAMERASQPEEERKDFNLILDEFHTFATMSLATMLSELRKYRVGLTLAHQYLTQLDPELREAVLGNAGTLISFRVSLSDAEILAKEFYPRFGVSDLINLPNHHFYIKIMIDGVVSKSFSGMTLDPREMNLY